MSEAEVAEGSENPLLAPWDGEFGLPPFASARHQHFEPAFEAAMARHREEIAAIREDPAAATFDNTVAALERSGEDLRRVSSVFQTLAGADTNDALQRIERKVSPLLARHYAAIHLDEELYRRLSGVETLASELDAEEARVLERYLVRFRRAGAALPAPQRQRLAEIAERLAALGTSFAQNVLADERAYALVLETEEDLAGLPDFLRDAAAAAAAERGLEGRHVITLSRSSIEPFLQFSARRDLREEAFRAWVSRGEGGEHDNAPIMREMLELRAEKARLLGHENFAEFRLADEMAKTPDAALDLLRSVWGPTRKRAEEEAEALGELARAEGNNAELAPWDWRYYAEKRRRAEFALEEETLKPYFQLDRMIEAAFHAAHRLFGLTFLERRDLPRYHPHVRVWEVTDAEGRHVGLFLGDYLARASKRSGAWMSQIRAQHRLDGDVRPIVLNVANFAKASGDGPTLLSFDDARTLFHEFGHALHGLLSDVTYPSISGTRVTRDFVEFPSQIFEHWLETPEILRRFATHYRTGEPIPDALYDKLMATRSFNQGFATAEYLACAIADLELHRKSDPAGIDFAAFERRFRSELGMPDAIVMRHRLPHFAHIFAGDGYSAAYYSYMWAEVLDADGYEAFEEAGDPFDPGLAAKLREHVYAAGFRRDPAEAFRAFRGRDPEPDALLRQRGLHAPVAEG